MRATLGGVMPAATLDVAGRGGANLTRIRKAASRCSRAVEVAVAEHKERSFKRARAPRRGKVSHV